MWIWLFFFAFCTDTLYRTNGSQQTPEDFWLRQTSNVVSTFHSYVRRDYQCVAKCATKSGAVNNLNRHLCKGIRKVSNNAQVFKTCTWWQCGKCGSNLWILEPANGGLGGALVFGKWEIFAKFCWRIIFVGLFSCVKIFLHMFFRFLVREE